MTSRALTFLPFDTVWKMRIDHPYSLLVKEGDLLWSCGQCPLSGAGEVLHSDELLPQAKEVIGFIERFLGEIDCKTTAVTRLTVYYVKTNDGDAAALDRLFQERFGPQVLITPITTPHFYYEGMLIEVDVFGSTRQKRHCVYVDEATGVELSVVETDALAWANLRVIHLPEDENPFPEVLERLMRRAGLSRDGLLAEQWFAGDERVGKSLTSMAWSPALESCGVLSIEHDGTDLLAEMTFLKNASVSRMSAGAALCLPEGLEIRLAKAENLFHVTACDNSGARGIVEQTRRIMHALERTLTDSGLAFHNVRKTTTHYVSGNSAEGLHENMAVRNDYYSRPGPASTGLPVKGFPNSNALISVTLTGTVHG